MTKLEALELLDREIARTERQFRTLMFRAAILLGVTTAALIGMLDYGLFVPAVLTVAGMLAGAYVVLANQAWNISNSKRMLRAIVEANADEHSEVEIDS